MSTPVRALYFPSAAALDWLRERVQAALHTWARNWVSGYTAEERLAVQVQWVGECWSWSREQSYPAVDTPTAHVWFRYDSADRSRLGEAVVGSSLMPQRKCADAWIAAAVDSACDACQRELCTSLLSLAPTEVSFSTATVPDSLFTPGSGAVHVSCEPLGLSFIADSAVWRSMPPIRAAARPRPKLIPLHKAVHRSEAQLEVMLGSVEVDLARLMDLRCGDVLRLPQRLDQGIAVLCDGKPLATAVLGEMLGQKSVRLTATIS